MKTYSMLELSYSTVMHTMGVQSSDTGVEMGACMHAELPMVGCAEMFACRATNGRVCRDGHAETGVQTDGHAETAGVQTDGHADTAGVQTDGRAETGTCLRYRHTELTDEHARHCCVYHQFNDHCQLNVSQNQTLIHEYWYIQCVWINSSKRAR